MYSEVFISTCFTRRTMCVEHLCGWNGLKVVIFMFHFDKTIYNLNELLAISKRIQYFNFVKLKMNFWEWCQFGLVVFFVVTLCSHGNRTGIKLFSRKTYAILTHMICCWSQILAIELKSSFCEPILYCGCFWAELAENLSDFIFYFLLTKK